ncbi:MAG: hypothetical protein ACI843_001087 [Psychrobacter glaciei]|jgi:hypothetical protein
MNIKPLAISISMAVLLSACGSDNAGTDSKATIESLSLSLVGTHESGNDFDTSSAEIVSYDKTTDKIYVVNSQSKTIDVLTFDTQGKPQKEGTIDLTAAQSKAGITFGAANSVVAKNGIVAIAIENNVKQSNGVIALYNSSDLTFINVYGAGALPDMVTMTDDSKKIVVANEGEPSGDYSNDPEGSVTVIDISNGFSDELAVVTQITFEDFNSGQLRHNELNNVRLPSPHGASVAQDLEPEYIAITGSNKAVISLQENNAFATIDLSTNTIESIKGLGVKSWASVTDGGNGAKLDLTNKDDVFTLNSYPQLVGYYMPDSISTFTINGNDYVISANEGDGREYIYETTQEICDATNGHTWDGDDYSVGGDDENSVSYDSELDDCISYTDEGRGKDLVVDAAHPLMNESVYGDGIITNKNAIGRIKVLMDSETISADGNVPTFGARSFSIWNENGDVIFDSGSQLSELANSTSHFNVSNDTQKNDNRSDDKGVEPEAMEIAVIEGSTIAFIGLERQGGVAVYDVSIPEAPVFLDYLNNRDFTADVCTVVDEDGECDNNIYNPAAGDLGPESIEYFSRNNQHFIAVGNEVSGTTTVLELNIEFKK